MFKQLKSGLKWLRQMRFFKHQELTIQLSLSEISDRYQGQVFGLVWVVGHPLFLMGLYVFLFAYIFPSRTGITGGTNLTTYILSGLIPWLTFSELMSRSCTTITSSAGLVKQIMFPIVVLPIKTTLVTLVPQIISTFLLFCWIYFFGSASSSASTSASNGSSSNGLSSTGSSANSGSTESAPTSKPSGSGAGAGS